MRGNLANKGREGLGDAYGLSGRKKDEVVDMVEWLLKDLKQVRGEEITLPFLCGSLDIKVRNDDYVNI
jgi:hypothetical protein